MRPATELAGTEISQAPHAWAAYEHLVRTALEAVAPVPTVLLGVATPGQLAGWPSGGWLLLDCSDDERRARLTPRGDAVDIPEALADAAEYRALGLPTIDTTDLSADTVAAQIASWVLDTPRGRS
ncbi:hypothetical protein OHR68_39545 [Spirillospora sp. NBC_00431]